MSRHPSSPLSKAENFRLATQPHTQHHQLGEIAPHDSDTDSGICADSEQPSPRQAIEIPLIFSPNTNNSDYLISEGFRKPLLYPEVSRKLPQRPAGSATASRNIKTYRVRFADEVNSGASTSNTTTPRFEQSTSKPQRCATAVIQRSQPQPSLETPEAEPQFSKVPRSNNAYAHPPSHPSHTYENQLDKYREMQKIDRLGNYSYPTEEVETLKPPSYEYTINRLRRKENPRESIRDFVIRQNVNEALSRKLRSRSSSLPRMDMGFDVNETYYSPQLAPNYQVQDNRQNLMLRSLEDLHIGNDSLSTDTVRRRKLPVAPLLGPLQVVSSARVADPAYNTLHPALMARRSSEEQLALQRMSRRSASIGPQCEVLDYGPRREPPAVRAVLVALDQCGFRTVMVEKTQPGPFGFYIATGVMNGQRGIFISRVSIASLSPMLSVGDEILYVDDQLVKGRSLETVQALIAGKTKVLIVLLPAIGNCI
ncbi:unnamed protein product [Cylicocyclus nassatus]|uniref:PDZ domain-containing protein n=1 Tax=Cylicocyclus nassatus TaxID=53992 RepID=A0AA36HGV7_CYLNA|nr:unnamed protein product [Cylicocyclus nassatus]